MSAAEPAIPPTPPTALNTNQGAAVINLETRRTRRSPDHTRGGQTSMNTPPGKPFKPEPANPEHENGERLVAEHVEKVFNAAGNRTLSNPETAFVYVTTLGAVQHTLHGAAASGIISEQQRAHLAGLIAGMAEAPGHV